MRRANSSITPIALMLLAFAATVRAAVEPANAYAPLGQTAEVVVSTPNTPRGASSPQQWIALISFDSGAEIARSPVRPGCTDLLELFPSLKQAPPLRALLVQAFADETPDGPAVVLVPMWTPARFETALTAMVRNALRERSTRSLDQLLRTAPGSIDALDRQVVEAPDPNRAFSGYRLLIERRVRLLTSLGEFEFAPRHDAAPNHCAAFLRLVEGGFYNGTPIHRLVSVGPNADPVLVQMGDPTGTGLGGAGERIAHEHSNIPQRLGILSMARVPGDPDSASSQLIVALSDKEAPSLEGAATPIAELTGGAEVLNELASVPVGPRVPGDPTSPKDRPLANLVIERAWTVPAPPRGTTEPAPAPAPPPPIER